jgi:poly-beta-1,6-N-acetyl-D-glucosamine N-deacetylase PgaB
MSTPLHRARKLTRHLLLSLALSASALMPTHAANATATPAHQTYLVLCYHSVPVRATGNDDTSGANSITNFAGQLAWLRSQGYSAISMDDVLKASSGQQALPAKSFLLTVDDGYEDFYQNVFPLLKLYRIPAVFGLVGRWIEEGRDPQLSRTDPQYARQHFVNWQQVKEMADSGLVEMASHSYDLHHGVLSNPQQNYQPAAVTQEYDPDKQTYETPEQRRLRVRNDLRKNAALIARHTGKQPRIMVWPYGAMDRISGEEAAAAGMRINLTLTDGLASTQDTEVIPRNLIGAELPLTGFTYMITHRTRQDNETVRAIKINLDRIYDPDPLKEDAKLGRLLEQTARLGVNTVLLQPLVTLPGNRYASAAYFPNSVLPMRGDLLNRTAWQFRNRLGVDVFMLIETRRIARSESGILHPLDIADAEDREYLLTLYSELSLASSTQGLMFDSVPADIAQFDFNLELLGRSSYVRPPPLYYAASDEAEFSDIMHLTSSRAVAGPFDRIMVPPPMDASPAQLARFLQQLPANRIGILSLPVNHAGSRQLQNIASKIAVLKRHGVDDFMLDGDSFMDDPADFELMRQAISLKNNPLVTPGK